jgi:hypothetical protein
MFAPVVSMRHETSPVGCIGQDTGLVVSESRDTGWSGPVGAIALGYPGEP